MPDAQERRISRADKQVQTLCCVLVATLASTLAYSHESHAEARTPQLPVNRTISNMRPTCSLRIVSIRKVGKKITADFGPISQGVRVARGDFSLWSISFKATCQTNDKKARRLKDHWFSVKYKLRDRPEFRAVLKGLWQDRPDSVPVDSVRILEKSDRNTIDYSLVVEAPDTLLEAEELSFAFLDYCPITRIVLEMGS